MDLPALRFQRGIVRGNRNTSDLPQRVGSLINNNQNGETEMKKSNTNTGTTEFLTEQPKLMFVFHPKHIPSALTTLTGALELCPNYSAKTVRLYASMGGRGFPEPVGIVGGKGMGWLYRKAEVVAWYNSRMDKVGDKSAELLARSRKLAAEAARLRYRANKANKKFNVVVKTTKKNKKQTQASVEGVK